MVPPVSSLQMAVISLTITSKIHVFSYNQISYLHLHKMCVFKESITYLWPQCLLSVVNTLIGYMLREKLHLRLLSQS